MSGPEDPLSALWVVAILLPVILYAWWQGRGGPDDGPPAGRPW